MNRQQILDMPAGRELDALVAEKCLGLKVLRVDPSDPQLRNYSTDLNAAWPLAVKYYMNIAVGLDRLAIQACEYNRDEEYKKVGSAIIGKLEEIATLICKACLLAELGL